MEIRSIEVDQTSRGIPISTRQTKTRILLEVEKLCRQQYPFGDLVNKKPDRRAGDLLNASIVSVVSNVDAVHIDLVRSIERRCVVCFYLDPSPASTRAGNIQVRQDESCCLALQTRSLRPSFVFVVISTRHDVPSFAFQERYHDVLSAFAEKKFRRLLKRYLFGFHSNPIHRVRSVRRFQGSYNLDRSLR